LHAATDATIQRMQERLPTIVWLFGPDGAGKTHFAQDVAAYLPCDIPLQSFTGSKPDTWPLDAYRERLAQTGLDDATCTDPDYFATKARIGYQMAADIADQDGMRGGIILIDSCVIGKTVLANYARSQRAERMQTLKSTYAAMGAFTLPIVGGHARQLGVHVTWKSPKSRLSTRAAVVLDRIKRRETDSHFDPTILAQSKVQVEAGDMLETLLQQRQRGVMHVNSNPAFYDIVKLTKRLVDATR
jgi:hypothetical protein